MRRKIRSSAKVLRWKPSGAPAPSGATDSSPSSTDLVQQELPLKEGTAGLRVITVILAVMLLHVLFIGGVALYHLLSGEGKPGLSGSAGPRVPTVASDAVRARPGGRPEEGSAGAPSAASASSSGRGAADRQADASPLSALQDSGRKSGGRKRPLRASPRGNGEKADVSEAAAANGQRTGAAAAAPRIYRVVRGDSLWRIARRFHVGLDDLMKANQLTPASKLQIGQELRIPAEKANRGRRSGGLAGR